MSGVAVLVDRLDPESRAAIRWLAGLEDLHVFADLRTPALEQLVAEVGATLSVSDQRTLPSAEGLRFADQPLAEFLADRHRTEPWTAIVVATDAVHDPAWDEPLLEDVPLGRVLAGPLRTLRTTLDDPRQFAETGSDLMALAGDCAVADFTLDPFGLGRALLRTGSSIMPGSRTDAGQGSVLDVRGDDAPRATSQVRRRLEATNGLVFVIATDPSVGPLLERTLVPEDRERCIVVAPEQSFALRLLGEDAPPVGIGQATRQASQWPPTPRPGPNPRVVPIEGPRDVAAHLAGLDPADVRPSVLAIEPTIARPTRRSKRADLAFAARRREPMGEVDPTRLRTDWVMVGPAARSAIIEAARHSSDLRQLFWRLTEPALISSVAVALLPAPADATFMPLRTRRQLHDAPVRIVPPLLPMPNLAVEPPASGSTRSETVKEWAGRSPWSTRIRLAMPWRWGLLPKSMKDRW